MLPVFIITAIGVMLDISFIETELAGNMKKAVILKGAASLCFVLLGAFCYAKNPTSFGVPVLIGLVLGMVGDIFLNMRNIYEDDRSKKAFAIGIVAFIAGHFLYIAALIGQNTSIVLPSVLITAVLSVISIPLLIKQVTAPSMGLRIFGYVYLVIVILMFSCAAVLLFKDGATIRNKLFAIGAFLFMVSDFIMICYTFGKKLPMLRRTNLILYYVGQILIALCLLGA